MEIKTNEAKLEIFKFLRKWAELQGYIISAMKTVQNPTVFMKTQK